MNFDVYQPMRLKDGRWVPGVKARSMDFRGILEMMSSDTWATITDAVRSGEKARKMELPAVCWTGKSLSGYRKSEDMEPTQFVMVDIDHCKDAADAWNNHLSKDINNDEELERCVLVVHFTPSMGIRIVFRAIKEYPTLREHMEWLRGKLHLDDYGDFDSAVKDFSRLSFLVNIVDFVFINHTLADGNYAFESSPLRNDVNQGNEKKVTTSKPSSEGYLFDNTSVPDFTEEEAKKFDEFEYRGNLVKNIIAKYVENTGTPTSGEIHNYYNELVKNFRNLCDNNPRILLYLLPRFGHSVDECWSQIKSITRVNTISRLEKNFYYFLKNNGYYEPRSDANASMKEYMMKDEEENTPIMPPYLPPVFRELVGIAPRDFVLPAVNALLPIMGTLTSYLKAVYPYDNREHTTSFFSVIYAPPGTGKGFVERYMDLLFADIKLRDFVQSERENVFLRVMQRKGANENAPAEPHTSLRIIPAKNSEAEFLQKQRDNHGYHMFTYAAEMDSWAKGVKAAGGNKDDMIRIAWDNGEYGQQFKSYNTFKGMVKLFWNVLITGTIAQVDSYFKNVENGLVTRCSFTSIDNQEFSAAPVWKSINKRGMETIRRFMSRCDERTYETPCTVSIEDLSCVEDDKFDKEIDWRFKFKERQMVDMSWIMPTIKAFHSEQMKKAALDIDRARDVFRRRVGVRGFRLGLLCYGLWDSPRQSDLDKCCAFVDWWMHRDIECMLKLWGARYNELNDTGTVLVQRTVFDNLEETFSKPDVYTVCMKQGIKTPIRRILFDWRKLGYIEQLSKDKFKKKNNGRKAQ